MNDDDAPMVTCPASTATINTNGGGTCEITIPDYVSTLNPTDNCTAPGDLNESQDVPAGAYSVSGDGATVTVTYTVTDDATPANSTTCQVVITVNDDDAPIPVCNNITVYLNSSGIYNLTTANINTIAAG